MNRKTKTIPAGWLWLITGAVFIAIGAFRGETGIVLMKAVRICMECIGIG